MSEHSPLVTDAPRLGTLEKLLPGLWFICLLLVHCPHPPLLSLFNFRLTSGLASLLTPTALLESAIPLHVSHGYLTTRRPRRGCCRPWRTTGMPCPFDTVLHSADHVLHLLPHNNSYPTTSPSTPCTLSRSPTLPRVSLLVPYSIRSYDIPACCWDSYVTDLASDLFTDPPDLDCDTLSPHDCPRQQLLPVSC